MVAPESLQDAKTRVTQSAIEKEAWLLLGQAEVEIVQPLQQAADAMSAARPAPFGP